MSIVPFRRNVSLEDAVEEFIYFKMAEGRAERTIEDYRRHLRTFFKRFPNAFDPQKARKCVFEYMTDHIKPATYNLRLVYLRSFFSWCVSEGILPSDPTEGLKRRKDKGRAIVSVEDDALKLLLELPDRQTFAGLRDYAPILLTLDTGIRSGEALSLIPPDINFRDREVYVRAEVAKTRTRRTLPISPATAKAISKLLSARLGMRIRPYDPRHAFTLSYLRKVGDLLSLLPIWAILTLR